MRFRSGLVCLGVAGWLGGGVAHASFIAAPDIGATDGAMCGNVVAVPNDGPDILFHNAAGIVGLEGTTASYGLFAFPINGRYSNSATGFDEKSSELAASPVIWLATDAWAPWYFGGGLYGTVGTSFNFGGDPALGFPNRFLGESSVLQAGMVAGRELIPGLRVGAQISPSYGSIRLRAGSPKGPISFDLQGFGIGGTVGVLYDLTEHATIGVSYRSPSRVYLSGDADVGAVDDEVEIDLHVPQNIAFGFAYRFTEDFVFTAQSRWTDYPDFENGEFEYDRNPDLNAPFIRSAKSRFRYGAAFEYGLGDGWILRGGTSGENWMMEPESLSPILYDNSDWIFGIGLGGVIGGRWVIDGALGYTLPDDRVVTADENPVFPGRYELEVPIVAGFMISYRFGEGNV